MRLHRNSPKRYYVDQAVYFITTNTGNSYPFFKEDILCDLFVEDLLYCKKIKRFEIYGYKINPEHVHLLIQPDSEFNFSNIMGSIKRNFARDCNHLFNNISFIRKRVEVGDDSNRRLPQRENDCFMNHIKKLNIIQQRFNGKFKSNCKLPEFKWQKSFYDHIIRDQNDFYVHLQYIKNQWIKHNLKENKYCFVEENT